MGEVLATVKLFLDTRGWPYEELPAEPAIHLRFGGTSGQWSCLAAESGDGDAFVFYSVLPIRCPEAGRSRLVDFLARANHRLVFGNFEMDPDSGEIRFKTSQLTRGVQMSLAMCALVVDANLAVTDASLGPILGAMFGDGAGTAAATSG